jgi:hypothetical protein
MSAYLNTAQLSLDTASEYLNQGWIEIDLDDYDPISIESRLSLVANMIKSAEYALAKYNASQSAE